jgi:hypothetical protein
VSKDIDVEILETDEYGVVLRCRDIEVADKFEDFLTEQRFVLFNIRPEDGNISFFFGQASVPARVQELYEQFSHDVLKK